MDDERERCPNCGDELRMVKNVGRVHWADGAWRLCPNPPSPADRMATALTDAIAESKQVNGVLKAAVKRATA